VRRTISEHRQGVEQVVHDEHAELTIPDVIPGFSLRVRDAFDG
jgi:hypothetical protein